MEDHLAAYLLHLEDAGRSPRTVHQYRHKLKAVLAWLDGRTPTPALLHQYRLQRQQAGIRPRTLRCDFSALWDFFKWLEAEGHATGLPRAGSVKLPSMDDAQRARPTDADVAALFAAAEAMPAHTDRKRYLRGRALCVLALLAGAGLRRAELLAVNVQDLKQGEPWSVHVCCGKGAQSGFVPLGAEAQAILEEWLVVRRRWCYLHKHTSDALIPVDSRRRLANLGLDTIWQELIELAGLQGKGYTPHGLRHWYGTRTAAAVDLPTAQKMLRHRRISTTLGYLGTDGAKMQAAAESIRFRIPDTQREIVSQSPPAGTERRRLVRQDGRRRGR